MTVASPDRAPHTRWTTIEGPQIALAPGAERSGLAVALREFVALNVRDSRAAARAFERLDATAALRVTDADAPVTLDFRRGRLTVHVGAGPRPADVTIITDALALMSLAEAPKAAALPDLRTAHGRIIVRWVLTRRIRLRGAVRHPLTLAAVALLTNAHRADRGEWPPR